MKKFNRLLAMLIALLVMVSSVAALAEEAPAADVVLFTFDGSDVMKSTIEEYTTYLKSKGYIDSDTDYAAAIEGFIQNQLVPAAKIAELGFDIFSEEEMVQVTELAKASRKSLVDAYVQQYQFDAETASQYLDLTGGTEAYFIEYTKATMANERLTDYCANVTEDEVQAKYEEICANDEEAFKDNLEQYDYMVNYYGYSIWYVPEGYRAVLQILLEVDETFLSQYKDAETEADKAAAEALILESKQDVIDDINTRLANGEDILTLIEEYNIDSGMSGARLTEGYYVHRASHLWDAPFLNAAFSEKMVAPGSLSDPAVGAYGVYMVYYLRDLEPGIVPMNDNMRDYIVENLKAEDLFAQLRVWATEYEIIYNVEELEAMTGRIYENQPAKAE